MTPSRSTDILPASEVIAATAALADHLQRAGVRWLPTPRRELADAPISRLIELPEPSDQPRPLTPETPAGKPPSAVAASGVTASVVATERAPGGGVGRPSPPSPLSPVRPPQQPGRLQSVSAGMGSFQPYPGPSLPAAERRTELESMASEVAACTRCPSLVACRKTTVFGEGSESPRVVFFGEGPGADEDRTGRPFVGKAGQLLTKMIEACTFRREDVYILNTVKCRPPANRNPEPQEITNCREYFERQLNLLRPQYIVCLGAISSQALLQSKLSVGRLRGTLHQYFESKVIVTYHPAYLLRTPAAKKAAWDDLRLMLRDAGINP